MTTTPLRILPAFLLLAACSSSGGGGVPDWTKRPTKRYEAKVAGVSISIDKAPDDLVSEPNDKKGWDTTTDHWFRKKNGRPPYIGITVSDSARDMDEDVLFTSSRSDKSLVDSQKFDNGYAYTWKDDEHSYKATVVLHLSEQKSVQCVAMGGDNPPDPRAEAQLPALQAICRTLVADGTAIKGAPQGAPVAATDPAPAAPPTPAAGALPAECSAYLDLMGKLAACDKLDQNKRDGLKFAADRAASAWKSQPADKAASLADECKAGAASLADDAKTCGL